MKNTDNHKERGWSENFLEITSLPLTPLRIMLMITYKHFSLYGCLTLKSGYWEYTVALHYNRDTGRLCKKTVTEDQDVEKSQIK